MQNTLKQIAQNDFCTKINACPSRFAIKKADSVNKERCDFCTDLIDSMKSMLVDTDMDQLKQSFNSYCELTGDFKDECQKNLDQNLENLIDFVQSKMDSELFCHAIKSCHHQTIEEKSKPTVGDLISLRDPLQMASHFDSIKSQENQDLANSKSNMKGALTCMICRQIISAIYTELHRNKTRANVENLLAKSCKAIFIRNKVKEKECEEKIVKNAEMILQSFINNVPPEIVCLLNGMCIPGDDLKPIEKVDNLEIDSSLSVNQQSNPLNWGQDYKCYFCERIVDFLFKELDTKRTREWIKKMLDRSCNHLFKREERETKCEEYVNAYTDKLIDLIEKAKNPGLICNALHMCPVNFTKVEEYDAQKLNSGSESKNVEELVSVENSSKMNVDWCGLCERTYPILSEIAQIDAFKNSLKDMGESFCNSSILPINVEQCNKKVDEYIQVLATVRDSQEGCEKVNLCPTTKMTEFDISIVLLNDKGNAFNSNQLDDLKCTTCKMLIKNTYEQLDHIIHDQNTADFIDRACQHIHQEELKDKCKTETIVALETILKDFEKELPPTRACEMLQYCKKKDNFENSTQLDSCPDGKCKAACKICKIAFPQVHKALSCPKIREAALNVTKRLCNLCPAKDKCYARLSNLIKDLADSKTAEEGCSSLCKNDFSETFSSLHFTDCTMCQVSMMAVQNFFDNDLVRTRLNETLEQLCDSQSDKQATKCKQLIRTNLPKFYEKIHNLTDHNTGFCVQMGYCKKSILFEPNALALDQDGLLKGNENLIPDEDLLPNEDLLPSYNDLLNDQTFMKANGHQHPVCQGCRKVFTAVNKLVRNKKEFKEKLLKKLQETCPQSDDKCREFFKNYINYFYNMLLRNTDPERSCAILKLCPDELKFYEEETDDWKPDITLIEQGENPVCKECQSAVTYLITTLKDKKVVNFLMDELQHKICDPLSFIERKACSKLIKSFGPKLMGKLVNKLNKDKICTEQLKLCPKDNYLSNWGTEMEFDLINFVENPNCVICLRSVNKLNAKRGESSNRFSVEEICGEDDVECNEFMFNFQEFFYENNANRDSMLACNELDICLIPGRVQLLGGNNKCKFGPSYFCMSAAHAEACDRTKFCYENHWIPAN